MCIKSLNCEFYPSRTSNEEKEKQQNTENNNEKKPVEKPSAHLVEDEDYKVQQV